MGISAAGASMAASALVVPDGGLCAWHAAGPSCESEARLLSGGLRSCRHASYYVRPNRQAIMVPCLPKVGGTSSGLGRPTVATSWTRIPGQTGALSSAFTGTSLPRRIPGGTAGGQEWVCATTRPG